MTLGHSNGDVCSSSTVSIVVAAVAATVALVRQCLLLDKWFARWATSSWQKSQKTMSDEYGVASGTKRWSYADERSTQIIASCDVVIRECVVFRLILLVGIGLKKGGKPGRHSNTYG